MYEDIAEILAGEMATCTTKFEIFKVRGIILSLADFFNRENKEFDRAKFYKAAGLTSNGGLTIKTVQRML